MTQQARDWLLTMGFTALLVAALFLGMILEHQRHEGQLSAAEYDHVITMLHGDVAAYMDSLTVCRMRRYRR